MLLTDPTPDAVRVRLRMFADLHAARLGFRFGSGSAQLMDGLVDRAVDAVGAVPDGRREVAIRQAEAALGVFVETMVATAQQRLALEPPAAADGAEAVEGRKIIGETTFAAARLSLCPCWPIC
jgi:hypothetical protein